MILKSCYSIEFLYTEQMNAYSEQELVLRVCSIYTFSKTSCKNAHVLGLANNTSHVPKYPECILFENQISLLRNKQYSLLIIPVNGISFKNHYSLIFEP